MIQKTITRRRLPSYTSITKAARSAVLLHKTTKPCEMSARHKSDRAIMTRPVKSEAPYSSLGRRLIPLAFTSEGKFPLKGAEIETRVKKKRKKKERKENNKSSHGLPTSFIYRRVRATRGETPENDSWQKQSAQYGSSRPASQRRWDKFSSSDSRRCKISRGSGRVVTREGLREVRRVWWCRRWKWSESRSASRVTEEWN